MDTGAHGSAGAALPARGPAHVRRAAPAARGRLEERLAEARERELRARRELALALARAEETWALAVRTHEALDDYLSGVRRRLQQAGYLAPTGHPGGASLGADGASPGKIGRRRAGSWSSKARLRLAAAALRSGH